MKKIIALLFFAGACLAQVVPGRYFVTLNGEPAATALAKRGLKASAGRELSSERARVAQQQALVRVEVEKAGGRVLSSVDIVANALIVEMTAEQAAQARNISGVRDVVPVHRTRKSLDQALPIHQIPAAWALLPNGKAGAGAGVKIAVLDTGIDVTHPAFAGAGLTPPAGFPKTDGAYEQGYTNSKIIVVKNYSDDFDGNDDDGHGTAVSMCAAGATITATNGPISATITGAAPAAFLGNYKIFGADGGTDAMFVQALNDVVADGMDIATTSIGDSLALPPASDISAQAVETAVSLGLVMVAAAGNEGPDPNSLSSPGTAPSAIAVGSSRSNRDFPFYSSLVIAPNANAYQGVPGDGSFNANPVTAAAVDVSTLDPTGLACGSLPGGSLTGNIAVIERGTCTFATKISNAQAAGAVAVVLYMNSNALDAFDIVADPSNPAFGQGSATLPAVMIGYYDGLDLNKRIAASPGLQVQVQFLPPSFVPVSNHQMSVFSSAGPGLDLSIKPELAATGDPLILAAEMNDPSGELYDPTGITVASGTSFSAPLVAGAIAVLKGAKPGLTAQQYRSLIVNSSSLFSVDGGGTAPIVEAGAGILNLLTSMQSTVTASPVTMSFGTSASPASQTLTLTNIGGQNDTLTLSVISIDGVAPAQLSSQSLAVASGASGAVTVQLGGSNLQAGAYQGFIKVQSAASGAELHIPYWYAVPSATPANIAILYNDGGYDYAGSSVPYAISFRVTDSSGVPIAGVTPQVAVLAGAGSVTSVYRDDPQLPGTWDVDVILDFNPGSNVFKIKAGGVTKLVEIIGE